MENDNSISDGIIHKEVPQLITVLKEMKDGLDGVKFKVQTMIDKVKANDFPTANGISYLETKYLLLLNYCQSLVYYSLRKAKGLSVAGHPVVYDLVELRLFLEKIRPIEKKYEYQIQKLVRDCERVMAHGTADVKDSKESLGSVDLLKYRPNPDMLVSKIDGISEVDDGVYRPPKFAPAIMEEDKMSKQERVALRREKETLRRAKQGYMKELLDDLEDRPEEVTDSVGIDSMEFNRYKEQLEWRTEQEEELFARVPITKAEKKKQKYLMKSRNGLLGISGHFYDEIKTLPLESDIPEPSMSSQKGSIGMGKLKKQKIKH